MAKIRSGFLAGDIRGSLGDTTFSRNKHGPYTKPRYFPDQTLTPRRAEIQEALAFVDDLWNTGLGDAGRAAWHAAANVMQRTKSPITPKAITGREFFIRVNMRLFLYDGNTLLIPPVIMPVEELTTVAAFADADAQTVAVSFEPDPVPSGNALVIFATMPMSVGRSTGGKLTRFISYAGPGNASPFDVTEPYTAVFGAPQPNSKIFFEMWLLNLTNGEYSVKQKATATVTGTGDAMLQRTTQITSTQFLDLVANPVQVVPPPGAGNYIVPALISISYHHATTPYVINAGGQLGFWLDSTLVRELVAPSLALLADQNQDEIGLFNAAPLGPVGDPTTWDNLGLYISPENGVDYSAGDGDFTITVTYAIHPIT